MSKTTKKALFGSLQETFALGIREFSRSLSKTLPGGASPKPVGGDSSDPNQISTSLDQREANLTQSRF